MLALFLYGTVECISSSSYYSGHTVARSSSCKSQIYMKQFHDRCHFLVLICHSLLAVPCLVTTTTFICSFLFFPPFLSFNFMGNRRYFRVASVDEWKWSYPLIRWYCSFSSMHFHDVCFDV
jgi:hypothetical protein